MSMFNAVSSSARQLYLLLRCINLTPKVQLQISLEGLRFSIDEGRTMRGELTYCLLACINDTFQDMYFLINLCLLPINSQ